MFTASTAFTHGQDQGQVVGEDEESRPERGCGPQEVPIPKNECLPLQSQDVGPPLDVHGSDGAPGRPPDEVGWDLVEVHRGPHVHDRLVGVPRGPRQLRLERALGGPAQDVLDRRALGDTVTHEMGTFPEAGLDAPELLGRVIDVDPDRPTPCLRTAIDLVPPLFSNPSNGAHEVLWGAASDDAQPKWRGVRASNSPVPRGTKVSCAERQ